MSAQYIFTTHKLSRRYPPEGFAATARRLAGETGCGLLFTGSAAEVDLIDRIRAEVDLPSPSLAGRLSLEGLITQKIVPSELGSAYEGLLKKKEEYLGVVVRWK